MFVAHRVSCFVLAAGATAAWPGASIAGSFLLAPGAWEIIQSATFTTSTLRYGPKGALSSADPYRKIEIGWLVQYGLTRNVTLLASPSVREVATTNGDETLSGHGLSSFEAGARWRLFDWRGGEASFQALVRIPGKTDPIFPLENRPRSELRLGYGFPAWINGKDGFVDASVAWVKRHEAQRDEIRHELTYGWWQRPGRMILLQYITTLYPGSGPGRDPWQHKIQTSTVHKLSDAWLVQLGSFWTRGGRETRRERGTVLALWRRF